MESERWALVLGASSGFGAAAAAALAESGFHVFGVHLDRRQTIELAEAAQRRVEAAGRRAVFFNVNAADPDTIVETAGRIEAVLGEGTGRVQVLMHSLAFGSLKPFISEDPKERTTRAQLQMTLEVMANSLLYWTQEIVGRGLMGPGGRIFAMTSSGASRVIPRYGPVSAAKASLEAIARQLAFELMPRGITVNALCAGVTDTPALRKIPGSDALLSGALERNPGGRRTTPEDVAGVIAAMTDPRFGWVTGNVIRVDGGEEIVA